MRLTPQQLNAPTPGPVLVLAPHPDDEVLGCGGALALHALRQDPIHVVVVFDGAAAAGDLDDDAVSREAYVARRRDESIASGQVLGGSEVAFGHEFWRLPEGHVPCDEDLERASRRLERLLRDLSVGTVYAPWPGDGHRDHRSVAQALGLALLRSPVAADVWGYEVWSALEPDVVLDVSVVFPTKLRALACHASQGGVGVLAHRASGLAAFRSSTLGGEARHAEAFRRFDPSEALALRQEDAA